MALVLAPVLSLIFAGIFSATAMTFWGNFTGQLLGFMLAGWVASRIAGTRGTFAVAAGLGGTWILLLLILFWRLPAHDSFAILAYVAGAILAAGAEEIRRRRQALRRSN